MIFCIIEAYHFYSGQLTRIYHLEHGVGFSQANRREARKLGLLYKQKFLKPNASEWSRWSVMSVFAGNNPTQILVLMENLGLCISFSILSY